MDLDDILNSALDEVELDEEEEDATPASSQTIQSALSEAAASSAKVQTEAAAKAAEAAAAAGAGGDELANLMKMFSGEDGGDIDKLLGDLFKDLDVNALISKLGETNPGGPGAEPNMEEILKLLGGPGADGAGGLGSEFAKMFGPNAGEQSEEEMTKMLDQMMKSVMSKELMHGPVKQICDEFPEHLKDPSISKEDRARFENQFKAYKALLAEFEVEGQETNTDRVGQIMRDLEAMGNPPPGVMKLVGGPGGAPGLGSNNPNPCPTQ